MYREIVFRLSAENHPDLANKLSGFTSQVRGAYDQLQKQAPALGGRKSKPEEESAARQAGLALQREIAAQREAEEEGRAALARRLRDYKKAKAEEAAEAEKTARTIEGLDGRYMSMQEQIRSANRETIANVAELGSSLMQAARGFTVLGLAGEEEMEVIVKGLMRIQGVFDVFTGGMQIWIKMQGIIEGTRRTLMATAAAEEALAAATTMRAAAQASSGVVGTAAGSAAGSALGSAGGAAVGAGAMGGARLLGRFLTGAIGKAGAIGGGLAGAAAVGAGVGMAADYFSGDGYSPGGFGERIGSGFLGPMMLGRADQFLNKRLGLAGGDGGVLSGSTFRNLADSQDRLDDQTKRSETMKTMFEAQAAALAQALPQVVQGLASQRASSAATLNQDLAEINRTGGQFGRSSALEVQKRLTEEILATEQRIADVQAAAQQTAGRHEALIKAFQEEALALEQNKRDLVVQRSTVARDAAEAELRLSERALQNVENLLENQQRSLMTMQERVRSSEERFGLMDRDQQQNVLSIFRRGQAGAQLSPEDLRTLKALGSEAADAIVAAQAAQLAASAGAGELFAKEREAIDKLTADIARNVDVRAEIAWEVELDKKAFEDQAAALDKAIRDSIAEQTDKVANVAADAMRDVVAGITVRMDNLEQRIKDGAGGRE